MAAVEDDFAAYTTIGDRVAVPHDVGQPTRARSAAAGPAFAVPAALEPFVLLSKSARGAAAAELVERATAAPAVYVFAELLHQPSIQDLAKQEQHAKSYRLLNLFAYGTWTDYDQHRDQYPKLSPGHEAKLKHLTILSLAAQSRILPYSRLLSTLSLESVPDLEDVLIDLFYHNVLTGRLDQKHSRLEVVTLTGRDVRPLVTLDGEDDEAPSSSLSTAPTASTAADSNAMQVDSTATATATSTPTATSGPTRRRPAPAAPSIASLHATLSSWHRTLQDLTRSLELHLGAVHAEAVNTATAHLEHEQRVRAVVDAVAAGGVSSGGGNKGAGGGGGGGAARNKQHSQAQAQAQAQAQGQGPGQGQGQGQGGSVAGGGGWKSVGATDSTTVAAPAEQEGGKMMDVDTVLDENVDNGPPPLAAAAAGGGGGGGGPGGSSGSVGRTRKRGRI
ncbi:hypothetical protein JCM3774_001758 [Rhodotorula dairenensis]